MVMVLRPVVDNGHVMADIHSGLAEVVLPSRTGVPVTVDDRMPEMAEEAVRMGSAEELHTAALAVRTGSAEDLDSRTDTLQAVEERVVTADTAQDMSPAEADDGVVVVKIDSLAAKNLLTEE
jgi:hypothetical protein